MKSVVALAGGVGGAKLALGFSHILGSEELTVVVNTADDDRFYGLHVSPDLDTVLYTLAGVSNAEMGWGLAGESFRTLERLKEYGVDAWFNLGDLDLATHLYRTKMLEEGKTLSEVCLQLAKSLGVEHKILPVTDSPIKTMVETQDGIMSFQEYFVKNRCEPIVTSIDFNGSSNCTVTPGVRRAVLNMDLLVFCPSNPFVSIAPILSVPGFKEMIESFSGKSIGVSPIVGGEAIKGPAAKMLKELGHDVSPVGVARQYVGLCNTFIIDEKDVDLKQEIESLGMNVFVTQTIMETDQDKKRLAEYILEISV
ncbi:MAG: 2-phospho-L-lactate transferase [Dehalococcoidia bacterium]|nr:2-phospho-L-lactate transferase [Dehalococcoidia bacterium]|tara:strand:+ start:4899 stop:5828 length:930 start_codon:yes stop_codon:yes gene_type:complete